MNLIANEFIPWAPWHIAPDKAKVALVATAGVYLKHGLHAPLTAADPSFREFPAVVSTEDLALAESGFDLRQARADLNVVFPLERMKELADAGYIGTLAPFAYTFSGGEVPPVELLANYAPSVAYRVRRMGAEVALVVAAGEAGQQTAALVARAIELAGVPTIVLGTDRAALEAVKVPRAVVVQHPVGSTLGNPNNSGKHQHLLREVFDAAWQFEGPGLVAELAYSWSGE